MIAQPESLMPAEQKAAANDSGNGHRARETVKPKWFHCGNGRTLGSSSGWSSSGSSECCDVFSFDFLSCFTVMQSHSAIRSLEMQQLFCCIKCNTHHNRIQNRAMNNAKACRPTKSFRPEPDVESMLDRAKEKGVGHTWIINKALREFLIKEGYARKKELAA